jgi:hypothetical protein
LIIFPTNTICWCRALCPREPRSKRCSRRTRLCLAKSKNRLLSQRVLFANRNQHRSLLLRLQSYQKHRGFQKGPIGFSARRFSAPLKILELEEKKPSRPGTRSAWTVVTYLSISNTNLTRPTPNCVWFL